MRGHLPPSHADRGRPRPVPRREAPRVVSYMFGRMKHTCRKALLWDGEMKLLGSYKGICMSFGAILGDSDCMAKTT